MCDLPPRKGHENLLKGMQAVTATSNLPFQWNKTCGLDGRMGRNPYPSICLMVKAFVLHSHPLPLLQHAWPGWLQPQLTLAATTMDGPHGILQIPDRISAHLIPQGTGMEGPHLPAIATFIVEMATQAGQGSDSGSVIREDIIQEMGCFLQRHEERLASSLKQLKLGLAACPRAVENPDNFTCSSSVFSCTPLSHWRTAFTSAASDRKADLHSMGKGTLFAAWAEGVNEPRGWDIVPAADVSNSSSSNISMFITLTSAGFAASSPAALSRERQCGGIRENTTPSNLISSLPPNLEKAPL